MTKLSTPTRVAIVAIAIIIVAGALHVAAVAALPIVASVLLGLLLWPLREWLDARMPRGIAAALCGVLLVLVLAAVVGWGWYASSAATDEFRSSREKYIEQYGNAREWLTGIGIPNSSVPELSTESDNGPDGETSDADAPDDGRPLLNSETRREIAGLALGGLRSVIGAFFALMLTIFLAVLVLYEGDRWAAWARDKFSHKHYARVADLAVVWSRLTRWYLLGKTTGGLASGTLTWLWLWTMGVPLAFVWGVFTFFMNFIPNIGALISGLPATILAIVYLGWGKGLIVAAGLVAIETLCGNFISPYFESRMLKLSLWVVLASLVFWGWLWGIVGAVLAPILTAVIYVTVLKINGRDDAIPRAE